MLWLVLIVLAAGAWYYGLSTPPKGFPRDWRLNSFQLTAEEEHSFHSGVRKLVGLTCAIFFSVCLVIAFVVTVLR